MMKMLAYGRNEELMFDGHAPCVVGKDAMAYYGTGPIRTDHEAVTVEEAFEKYSLGVHVILRRGSLEDPVTCRQTDGKTSRHIKTALGYRWMYQCKGYSSQGTHELVLRQIVYRGSGPPGSSTDGNH